MSANFAKPHLAYHADWSKNPSKRWCCQAVLGEDGGYSASGPRLVGDTSQLLERLKGQAGGGPVFAGFDFPIGLPAAYAERAGISRFRDFLPLIGSGEWEHFHSVCDSPEEISNHRPFYPNRSTKGTTREHLAEAHGAADWDQLLRRCEVGGDGKKGACSLFWTLGGNQVGKAALAGWNEVLVPGIADPAVKLWPFDGKVETLWEQGGVVVAETYPAECYSWLAEARPIKTNLESRRSFGLHLLSWTTKNGVTLEADLQKAIEEGFLTGKDDAFDAVVGLFGMLQVCMGQRGSGEPSDPVITDVEGWILGRRSSMTG